MQDTEAPTVRRFLLGAGFSKPAGLPLGTEILEPVLDVARRTFRSYDHFSHLEDAVTRYENFLSDTDPSAVFDVEQFGAWLDWENTLELKGSDTFSRHGSQAGLQLRWAIGKVLHDVTPDEVPQLYLDFCSQLNPTDEILTLNYDLLLERSLEQVGLPYRRFPERYSKVGDFSSTIDDARPDELRLIKLHGSLDWTYLQPLHGADGHHLRPLVDGPRQPDDPLCDIGVVPPEQLDMHYDDGDNWSRFPALLMPPSTAKPLSGSALVPLWRGLTRGAHILGGFNVIGTSLPPGDSYVVQVVHHIATDYAAGRKRGHNHWPQRRMKVVDYRPTPEARRVFDLRFRFFPQDQTDFLLDGFNSDTLLKLFADDATN